MTIFRVTELVELPPALLEAFTVIVSESVEIDQKLFRNGCMSCPHIDQHLAQFLTIMFKILWYFPYTFLLLAIFRIPERRHVVELPPALILTVTVIVPEIIELSQEPGRNGCMSCTYIYQHYAQFLTIMYEVPWYLPYAFLLLTIFRIPERRHVVELPHTFMGAFTVIVPEIIVIWKC